MLSLGAVFVSDPICAATIDLESSNDNIHHGITFTGPIIEGDAKRLLTFIQKSNEPFFFLRLNSPGGSVDEAIKVAEVVERANLYTIIKKNSTCASACFLIWLAGSNRGAIGVEVFDKKEPNGIVGIHRPYLPNSTSPNKNQEQVMLRLSAYLERKLVPRRIIDLMMTRPSNDIYWLTRRDLEDLGQHPPHIEEFLIQKCSYDRLLSRRLDEESSEPVLESESALESYLKNNKWINHHNDLLRQNDCVFKAMMPIINKAVAAIRNGRPASPR